ncbi:calcium-binding protein [Pararhizobium sp. O133]|uniref:calcium-binding protein n=1 Tax=Pararhizobium sp. O133 TaxID=3449278 RepID=UPI003F6850C7
MAKITYGDLGRGVDMLQTTVEELFYYDKTSASSTIVKFFDDSKNYTSFSGTGLKVKITSGTVTDVTAGTVTGINVVIGGKAAISITGLKLSAAKLGDAVFAGNDAAFVSMVLSGNDTINGTKYSDGLIGGDGNDTLNGNAGNDDFLGGAGADKIVGGSGSDTAYYMFATKGVTASLAKASINTNEAKGDTYSSVENFFGSEFADKLYGNDKGNFLSGNYGNDVISGAGGNDILYGDKGADDLYGGAGKDVFRFGDKSESTVASFGRDTIFDFSGAGGDKIDLSYMDANSKTKANDAFTFIGTAAFHGKAGELRYEKKASDTYIYGDVNGDKKADFTIHLDDAVALFKGYFLL